MLVPLTAADEESPAASSPDQHSPAGWLSKCLPRLCRRQAPESISCLVRCCIICFGTMLRGSYSTLLRHYSLCACIDVQSQALPCCTRESASVWLRSHLFVAELRPAATSRCDSSVSSLQSMWEGSASSRGSQAVSALGHLPSPHPSKIGSKQHLDCTESLQGLVPVAFDVDASLDAKRSFVAAAGCRAPQQESSRAGDPQ